MSNFIKAHKTRTEGPALTKKVVHHSFFPLVRGDTPATVTVNQQSVLTNRTDPPPSIHHETLQRELEREYQRGFEAGRNHAEERLRQEFESRLALERERIGTLMKSIGEQLASYQERGERVALAVAFEVAKLIVKREVTVDNEIVLHQIREALPRVLGVERIKLRVNPQDEAMVRDHRAVILTSSDSIRDVLVEPDEKIEAGGCVIESDTGNVDARLSTQLKQIEAALIEPSSRPPDALAPPPRSFNSNTPAEENP